MVKSLHVFEGRIHQLHQSYVKNAQRLKRQMVLYQTRGAIQRSENFPFTHVGPSTESHS